MPTLVAVYRDRSTAEEVAVALAETGIEEDVVRVANPEDLEISVRAEMDAEVAESWGSPGLGAFMTAEMARGALLFAVVLGGLGLVIGASACALLSFGSWSTGGRALLGAIVGMLFGGTVGTILGGGLAMKSPEDRLAAERGVTVRCDATSTQAREIMAERGPIRLDLIAGTRRATLATESDGDHLGIAETIREFRDNSVDERRQG